MNGICQQEWSVVSVHISIILGTAGVCSFCWNLTKIFWVSHFVDFVLGRFSHFNIAIAYSNSKFCGAWVPSFCEFTCNFDKTSTPLVNKELVALGVVEVGLSMNVWTYFWWVSLAIGGRSYPLESTLACCVFLCERIYLPDKYIVTINQPLSYRCHFYTGLCCQRDCLVQGYTPKYEYNVQTLCKVYS